MHSFANNFKIVIYRLGINYQSFKNRNKNKINKSYNKWAFLKQKRVFSSQLRI